LLALKGAFVMASIESDSGRIACCGEQLLLKENIAPKANNAEEERTVKTVVFAC
jgi:hypothetical protein